MAGTLPAASLTLPQMPPVAPTLGVAPTPGLAGLPGLAGMPDASGIAAATMTAVATLAPAVAPALTSAAPVIAKQVMNRTVEVMETAVKNVSAVVQGTVRTETTLDDSAPKPLNNHMKLEVKQESILDTAKPFVIPIAGLIIGAAMMQVESIAMWGKLVLYFGAQSFMNIFMSWALGTHVTIHKGTTLRNGYVLTEDLKGCPAGFLLTALQQVVSFILFGMFYLAVYNTPHRYHPKPIKTMFEVVSIFIFGAVFAANIALNNFSLGYISIGVNLIIRSCLPLTTYLSQQGLSVFGLYTWKPFKCLEVLLMFLGVVCACVFTWADFKGEIKMGGRFIGVLGCLGSLLCGSLNLALAGVLGETKLNVLDTVAYMAVPATLSLLPIILFWSKPPPGQWKHISESMTDWEIMQETWYYSKPTVAWIFVSGVFSMAYNLVQFNIVHTLSPSATAFGGNFNKAALMFLTLCFPFLQTKPNPPMPYIGWEWTALIVNIYAFSHYSWLQIQAKQKAAAAAHKQMEDEEESSDEEDPSSSE